MKHIIVNEVYTQLQPESVVRRFRPEILWVMDFKRVSLRKDFLDEFVSLFRERLLSQYTGPVQIAGMESGALPLLSALIVGCSDRIVNAFYIRKSRKKGDLTKIIEGECIPGIPIVIIDDVLNSGSTIKKQVSLLNECGLVVSSIFVIIRYRDLKSYENIFEHSPQIFSLFELNDFDKDLNLKNFVHTGNLPLHSLYQKYEPVWKVVLSKANHYDVLPKSAPVIDEGVLYLGSDEGSLFAIDGSSGDKIWEFKTRYSAKHKGIYSSPVVHSEMVFFGAYDGNLYALDKYTGKQKWVFLDADFIGSSPCIAANTGILYIGLEYGLFQKHGGLAALDIATGKPIWIRKDISKHVHASPGYSEKHKLVVCGANDTYVYAHDAWSGNLKWKFKTDGEVKYGVVFDDKRDFVLVGSFDGGLYVINVDDGSLYHRFNAGAGFFSTPVIYDDLVIIGSLDRTIYAFSIEEKKIVWKNETNGRIFASPVIHRDMLYIGSNDGCMYILNPKTGFREAIIQLTERIVNKVCVQKESVFIPTHASELYRYDLKQ